MSQEKYWSALLTPDAPTGTHTLPWRKSSRVPEVSHKTSYTTDTAGVFLFLFVMLSGLHVQQLAYMQYLVNRKL